MRHAKRFQTLMKQSANINCTWRERPASWYSSCVLFSGPTRVKGATHETFYQMAEGHVPRPPAMVETLTYIKEFMNQVELHS